VLATEYTDYYSDQYYGNIELVSLLFDIYPAGLRHLSLLQWKKLLPAVFKYAAIKIIKIPRIIRYYSSDIKINNEDIGYYNKYSFNEHGDTYLHWQLNNIPFKPYKASSMKETVNEKTLIDLNAFLDFANQQRACIMMMPPVLQATTFKNQEYAINMIDSVLESRNMPFFRPPEEYCFADSLFFNTPYHLNKKGIEKRTEMMIKDLHDYFFIHGTHN
jgi:hypothetical protein